MKLTTEAAVTEFLRDFAIVIEQNQKVSSYLNPQGRKIFVDQRNTQEMLFLMQFYNRVAQMQLNDGIDLQKIFDEQLKEKGLYGINADEINRDLLILFSKYGFIEPAKRDVGMLNSLGTRELSQALKSLGDGNCFQRPVEDLILQVQIARSSDLTTDKSLDNIISSTRRLIAPKFGEKNCFSYDARVQEYKGKGRLNGLASVGNGLLGVLSWAAGLAIMAGTVALICYLGILTGVTALLAAVVVGGLVGCAVGSLGATCMFMLGGSLFEKADEQRKMAGTMFSIANAGSATKSAVEPVTNNVTFGMGMAQSALT
jgi:hypothetical protein